MPNSIAQDELHHQGQFNVLSNDSVHNMEAIFLSLVVPVYNEMETVGLFVEKVQKVLGAVQDVEHEIVFINDGSTDSTLNVLIDLQRTYPHIRIVDLTRNFGKEAALTAGLNFAQGQIVVPIDVDLQDPPELILHMIDKWREGFDVVLAKRVNRNSDALVKRISANWFYRIHNKLSEVQIPENVGDFRLMDRAVVDAIKALPESRRFMKGLFAWVGFRATTIEYSRPKRIAGKTKFSVWRLWNFALEGITSFSTIPLRVWTYLGSIVALVSLVFAVFIIFRVLIKGVDIPGYASIIVAVTFLGGLQLIGIGIIGEYLGRTYIESKRRPIYIVRRIYENQEK